MGEVVAKRMGIYAEEGIELEVTPGGPGVDGVASVAAGRAQSGQLSSSPSLMLARSAGIPVKAFAAGYQKHPFTYFSLANNPIRTLYYTTDDMLANHADVLTRFLTGSARGWGEARKNPEAGVDHLVAEYRNLSRESELEAVGPVLGFSFNEVTAKDGWAAMNPANWQAQIDAYAELKQF